VRNKKGVTLVELLVAMAILTIITGIVMSFFGLTDRLIARGDARTGEQHAVRMATDKIVREIRNIITCDLADAEGASGNWIFEDSNDLVLGRSSVRDAVWAKDNIATDGVAFDLRKDGVNYFMKITVTGTDGYVIETEVLLNNIKTDAAIGSGDLDVVGKCIEYTKD